VASKLRIGQPNRIRHTKNAQIGVAFQLGATKKLKMSAFGPECVKTPGHTLAMISENFIAREAHETVYPG